LKGGYELGIDCWIEPDEEIDPDEPQRYRLITKPGLVKILIKKNLQQQTTSRRTLQTPLERKILSPLFFKPFQARVLISSYFLRNKLIFGYVLCGAKKSFSKTSHAF
jgi:hypothetical protein